MDFLKRLGYTRELRAMKVTLEEETYIVEMGLRNKTAKVQIDFNTREIKEYEIQKSEEDSGSRFSKGKVLLLMITAISVLAFTLKMASLI